MGQLTSLDLDLYWIKDKPHLRTLSIGGNSVVRGMSIADFINDTNIEDLILFGVSMRINRDG